MADKQKNVIITRKARENLVRARAGDIDLPPITKMAFGNGGAEGGEPVPPTEDQTGLKGEIFQKDVDWHDYPVPTTCRYVCRLTEEECAGESISEIGLVDSEGSVLAIKTFSPKGKDDDIEMTFTLDDIF